MPAPKAREVWRLYNTDGVPSSGAHRPKKTDVIAWAEGLEADFGDAAQAVQEAGAEADRSATEADRAELAADTAQATARSFESWALLSAATGSGDGESAAVLETDAGTHSQATGTGYDGPAVNNAGRYRWSSSWSLWVRIGDLIIGGKASEQQMVVGLRDDLAGTPKATRAALEDREARLGAAGILVNRGVDSDSKTPLIVDAANRSLFSVDEAGWLHGKFDISMALRGSLGMLMYLGSGPVYPIIVDAGNRVLLGFDVEAGVMVGALAGGGTVVDYKPNVWIGAAS